MAKDSLIQFKGTSLKIIQTQLRTTDPVTLHSALAELTGNSPDFFEDELAVLDFSNAEDLPEFVDWTQLRELLRGSGLSAVATRGLPPALASAAAAAGLPQVGADALSRAPRVQVAKPPVAPVTDAAPPPPAEPQPAPRTVILDKPLRSGQRFYARGSDLIVTAMISAGAEVIADGNIHVYAPLRGRALATEGRQRRIGRPSGRRTQERARREKGSPKADGGSREEFHGSWMAITGVLPPGRSTKAPWALCPSFSTQIAYSPWKPRTA